MRRCSPFASKELEKLSSSKEAFFYDERFLFFVRVSDVTNLDAWDPLFEMFKSCLLAFSLLARLDALRGFFDCFELLSVIEEEVVNNNSADR